MSLNCQNNLAMNLSRPLLQPVLARGLRLLTRHEQLGDVVAFGGVAGGLAVGVLEAGGGDVPVAGVVLDGEGADEGGVAVGVGVALAEFGLEVGQRREPGGFLAAGQALAAEEEPGHGVDVHLLVPVARGVQRELVVEQVHHLVRREVLEHETVVALGARAFEGSAGEEFLCVEVGVVVGRDEEHVVGHVVGEARAGFHADGHEGDVGEAGALAVLVVEGRGYGAGLAEVVLVGLDEELRRGAGRQ